MVDGGSSLSGQRTVEGWVEHINLCVSPHRHLLIMNEIGGS